jgi:hypothetical protein
VWNQKDTSINGSVIIGENIERENAIRRTPSNQIDQKEVRWRIEGRPVGRSQLETKSFGARGHGVIPTHLNSSLRREDNRTGAILDVGLEVLILNRLPKTKTMILPQSPFYARAIQMKVGVIDIAPETEIARMRNVDSPRSCEIVIIALLFDNLLSND